MAINVDIRRTNARVSRGRAQKRTVSLRRFGKSRLQALRKEHERVVEELGGLPERPQTYGECKALLLGTVRPCPWVGCSHHLAIDVLPPSGTGGGGGLTYLYPAWVDDEGVPDVEAMHREIGTCALGIVAKRPDGMTLDEIGELLNLTRERVRQIETQGLRALRSLAELVRWQDAEAAE